MLSYRRGPDTPLLNRTTGEQLEHVAKRWPDRRALVSRHQRRQLSWAELLSAADGVARGLHSLGLEAGDRVGVYLPAVGAGAFKAFSIAARASGAITT